MFCRLSKVRHKDFAFTILELLVVIALSGVMLWISIPNLEALLGNRQLKEAAIQARSAIKNAIGRATRSRDNYLVQVTSDQLKIIRDPDQKQVNVIYPPVGIDFTPKERPIKLSKGGVSSPTRILISKNDRFCEVIIALRGRTRIECS